MSRDLVSKREIAHHEAGHAVIARVLGIEVEYATLATLDGDAGQVLTHSMAHSSPSDLAAHEKDAMVSLAGPQAQHRYRPLSPSAMERAWQDGDWSADRGNAMNQLAMLLLMRHGEPIVVGEMTFEGERAEEFWQLYDDTIKKTAALVDRHWPAIRRVAKALRAGRLLSQDDLDALITGDDA